MSSRLDSGVDTERLAAFLEGELSGSEASEVERELSASQEAREQLAQLQAIRAALAASVDRLAELDLVPAVMERVRREPRAHAAGRRWRAWTGMLGVAACIGLGLIIGLREHEGASTEFRPKAVRSPAQRADAAWTGFRVFRIDATGAPEPLPHEMRRRDGLMFSYVNAARPAYDYLMVFGVDADQQVRWFHPAYERADTDPTAVRIRPATDPQLLSEIVEHDLKPGSMTIYGVFTRRSLHVSEIERVIERRRDLRGQLGSDASVHTVEVAVRP